MKQRDQLRSLLKYAVLAPSGYNTQPWKFRLDDNSIAVLPDFSRTRISTDPNCRELFMSLGAAAFNLEIAAKYFGLNYQKNYLIDDKNSYYTILFTFSRKKVTPMETPLFKAISLRQINRFPFVAEPISKTLSAELQALPHPDSVKFHLITSPDDITVLSRLINRSFLLWSRQQHMVEELETWLRDDLESSPDGLSTGTINLYKLAINLKYFLRSDDPAIKSISLKSQNLAKHAPALALISTTADTIADYFQAGEFFELLALTLASRGYVLDFFNYPLSLKNTRHQTAALVGTSAFPQLLFRLGRPTLSPPRHSRRPLAKVLLP